MSATIGRIIHLKLRAGMEEFNNGSLDACGIIVRTWGWTGPAAPGAEYINVKVFTDGVEDLWLTSINLFRTRRGAEEFQEGHPGLSVAYWPAGPPAALRPGRYPELLG